MAKTSILSHVIITHTTKPQGAGPRNLGAHARKTDPGLKSLSINMRKQLVKCNSSHIEHAHLTHVSFTACQLQYIAF